MLLNKRKKQKVETFLLWNENILYEIVSFIKKPMDFIHLAETCKDFYNWTIGNEIALNLMFKNFRFYNFPDSPLLPNYLFNLKHLFAVFMSESNLQLFTKLESLRLCNSSACASTIENLKNLKCLQLYRFEESRNINFEILKEKLEELPLSGTQVEIQQIKCLQNLTNLSIGEYGPVECLPFFTKLKKLKAEKSGITDAHLLNLVHLEHLDLSECSKVNGLFLEKLTKLKYLDMRCCKNVNIDFNFTRLVYLEYLNLLGCNIKDITKLKLPNSLEAFSIDNTDICDEQLQHLENLSSLDLRLYFCKNLIGSYLNNKKKLKYLQTPGSAIIGEKLSLCTNLTRLEIRRCTNTVEFDFLSNLKNLVNLSISGNHCQVKDEHFQNIKKLKRLKMEHCDNLTDAVFLNLLNLKYLDCGGCKRIEGHNFKELKELRDLSVAGGNVLEENLSNLSFLKFLTIGDCPSFTGNCLLHLEKLLVFHFMGVGEEFHEQYDDGKLDELKQRIEDGLTLSYNEDEEDEDESIFGDESGEEDEELEETLSEEEEEESDASQ